MWVLLCLSSPKSSQYGKDQRLDTDTNWSPNLLYDSNLNLDLLSQKTKLCIIVRMCLMLAYLVSIVKIAAGERVEES